MTKKIRYTPDKFPDMTKVDPLALRESEHCLASIYREVEILKADGIPMRGIIVSLMLSAVKLSAFTGSFSPTAMRKMFDCVMDQYTAEDGEEE
jgi:hypothetical protein